jgi:hypothetical protein
MSIKVATLICFVTVEKDGTSYDLGSFPMLERAEGKLVGGIMNPGHFFDYFALAEDLINNGLLEDATEASLVCESIESARNEGNAWEGKYEEGGVIITYFMEPESVTDESGATFTRMPDGSYVSKDITCTSWQVLKEDLWPHEFIELFKKALVSQSPGSPTPWWVMEEASGDHGICSPAGVVGLVGKLADAHQIVAAVNASTQPLTEGSATLTLLSNEDMVTITRYSLVDGKIESVSECPTGYPLGETRVAVLKAGDYHVVLTGDMWRDIEMNNLDDDLLKLFMTGDPSHTRAVGALLESGVMPCLCGADHTIPESVTREYVNKDGEDEFSSVFGLGHYLEDGTFGPDESVDLSGGRFDNCADSDKCTACGGQI